MMNSAGRRQIQRAGLKAVVDMPFIEGVCSSLLFWFC